MFYAVVAGGRGGGGLGGLGRRALVGHEQERALDEGRRLVVELVRLRDLEAGRDGGAVTAVGLRESPLHVFSCHIKTGSSLNFLHYMVQ